jgi:glycine/D-amino acid oxidase-like deaminating enzyme
MARVVVAGAGAIGASIAYHLALRGADGVVLAEAGEIAGGATGKAMGGVRQQFTTEAEVRLAQASVRLFRELGAPLFEQVGYLFLATTLDGLEALDERRRSASTCVSGPMRSRSTPTRSSSRAEPARSTSPPPGASSCRCARSCGSSPTWGRSRRSRPTCR